MMKIEAKEKKKNGFWMQWGERERRVKEEGGKKDNNLRIHLTKRTTKSKLIIWIKENSINKGIENK